MNSKKTLDKIDIELTKTFFSGSSNKEGSLQPSKKAAGKMGASPRKNLKVLLVIGFLVITGIAAFSIYFFSHKRVVLDIDFKVEPTAEKLPATPRPTKNGTDQKGTALFSRFIVPENAKPPDKKHFYNELTLYDFEKDENGWEIPGWAQEKPDHVALQMKEVRGIASKGTGSIEVYAEFPGTMWTAAMVEIQQYLDLVNYDTISADIYLPSDAPRGLRAKLILTVAEGWKFVEMARSARLAPGKWTTITADLSTESNDWRRTKVNKEFKADVRKIAVRIESNKTPYSGPLYIDDVRVYSRESGERTQ